MRSDGGAAFRRAHRGNFGCKKTNYEAPATDQVRRDEFEARLMVAGTSRVQRRTVSGGWGDTSTISEIDGSSLGSDQVSIRCSVRKGRGSKNCL